jgi:hypothetical protein
MTPSGPLASRLNGGPAKTRIIPWLLAIVRAPNLDEELAAGIRPAATAPHQLRANHLRRESVRRRIAAALNSAVEEAHRPVRPRTAQAPLSREAIRSCRREIRDLATAVATLENPRTRGVAIAFQLAFDGRGALFFQPDEAYPTERLTNTVEAARRALSVSAEFE